MSAKNCGNTKTVMSTHIRALTDLSGHDRSTLLDTSKFGLPEVRAHETDSKGWICIVCVLTQVCYASVGHSERKPKSLVRSSSQPQASSAHPMTPTGMRRVVDEAACR